MIWTSLALEFCGLTLLALAMERHHEQVFGDRPARVGPAVLKAAGWLLLILATLPPIARYGPSIGLAVWVGELTIAALAVMLLHTYSPRLIPPLLAAAAFSTPALALIVG
ncbi:MULTISPECIES: DUF3325 domain-containing protein [Pusillimonas]|uniref:DUF3325 domain-containing protein n=1 Tax=Pusillimonas TaxID=305976 RepID=UPI000E5A0A4D|nr:MULTISPECIES: DUF3325 domain-containing protein [Pusillimonas]MDX3895866.1 DUF3325 domain-containing protein [Pusillimonas sp.]TFL15426.1 DUF3325 domain-containing protein [Pusillimonas caeni]